MKGLDFRRGRIFGINVIDLAVVLLILFLIFSFASKAISQELTYNGEQMHSAIVMYQKLDNRGFLVEGEIEGKWVVDETPFRETGLIASTSRGTFLFRTREGKLRTIGGSMAYMEDIAASKIVLKPLDNYLVVFEEEPKSFSSYDEFLVYLDGLKKEIGADNLYVTARLAFEKGLTLTEVQNLRNQLEDMYLLKDFAIMEATEEGLLLNFRRIDLEEMGGVKMEPGVVTTNRMKIFAGYHGEPPGLSNIGEYHVVSLEELK